MKNADQEVCCISQKPICVYVHSAHTHIEIETVQLFIIQRLPPFNCCPINPAITEDLNMYVSITLLTTSSIYLAIYLSCSVK